MISELTGEYIIENTECGQVVGRLEEIFSRNNLIFTENSIFSLKDFLSLDISLEIKVRLFVNKCKLNEDEIKKIRIDVANIVLPIFKNIYFDSEANFESAQKAISEGNEDVYNSIKAQFYNLDENAIMYAVYATKYCEDKSYEKKILDYLISLK